jgi:predicted RNA-binding Zn-ribbon protein involved in translation (DUF1610 family)
MTPQRRTDEPAEVVTIDGERMVRWDCPACDAAVSREIGGTPWTCPECGRIDREVEMFVEELSSRLD